MNARNFKKYSHDCISLISDLKYTHALQENNCNLTINLEQQLKNTKETFLEKNQMENLKMSELEKLVLSEKLQLVKLQIQMELKT